MRCETKISGVEVIIDYQAVDAFETDSYTGWPAMKYNEPAVVIEIVRVQSMGDLPDDVYEQLVEACLDDFNNGSPP